MNTEELIDTIRKLDLKQTLALANALRETLHISDLPAFEGASRETLPDRECLPAEDRLYNVVLVSAGASKIAVIKLVRELTGLGLAEAKAIVESTPKTLAEALVMDEAKALVGKLEAVGASARLV
jgi:large subunit ribosomal protein L7/L12